MSKPMENVFGGLSLTGMLRIAIGITTLMIGLILLAVSILGWVLGWFSGGFGFVIAIFLDIVGIVFIFTSLIAFKVSKADIVSSLFSSVKEVVPTPPIPGGKPNGS